MALGRVRPSPSHVKPVGWTDYDYTQSPTYFYDNGVNAQGRLSTVTLGPVVETYEYSVGGLVTKKKVDSTTTNTRGANYWRSRRQVCHS
ncbi:hypothetical protein [Paludibaculum fermentans]|uniref:Uncharacterized protein n=1 Tax=Paludibaculum fermentans TaxID=1473598 RepID=A0A7S7NUL6_PALFE|nr:hypothetical protein [Paludibaculum fermentans]QOY90028.1 hypothetical protein IRI77_08770 [Paludibaculum fermentans]